MTPRFTLTAFTPAEASAITGVSTASQRDWRRHGYLATGEGHARFDCFDLARMLVIRLLSDRGIGPAQTAQEPYLQWGDIAAICAAGVLDQAFRAVDAWEGDLAEIPTTAEKPEDAEIEQLISKLSNGLKPAIDKWPARARLLMKQLWRDRELPLITPGEIFIWWANGEHVFAHTLEAAMANISLSDPRTCGPIVVLNFASLSAMLQDRAGRALCHVDMGGGFQ